jgi:predicted phosphohydrolase
MSASASPPPPPPAPKVEKKKKTEFKNKKPEENKRPSTLAASIHHLQELAGKPRCAIVPVPLPEANTKLGKGSHKKKVTIVFSSDTHGIHEELNYPPEGDIFIHSGDFTNKDDWKGIDGTMPTCVSDFNKWLGKLPYKTKIVIAGNHEIGFNNLRRRDIQKILTNCIYVQDKAIEVEGIKMYGTPWTSSHNMGFSANKEKLQRKWSQIPEDIDILITHLPPKEIRDYANGSSGRSHWGSESLKTRVFEIKPKIHLYGHVHEEAGFTFDKDHGVMFVNGAADMIRNVFTFEVYV